MIDNLIFDTMKQIWIWSYILKFMSFLISEDFFKFFLNFYEFKIDLFDLNSILF